jgi:hypothetical protein
MLNLIFVAVVLTFVIVAALSLKVFFGKKHANHQPELASNASGGCGCGGCGCGGGGGQK